MDDPAGGWNPAAGSFRPAPAPGNNVDSSPDPCKAKNEPDERYSSWNRELYLTIALLVVIICCACMLLYSWESFVALLFKVVEGSQDKAIQALVINTVLVVMIVCCLPGPAFCIILDGFFFGFLPGFAYGFIAELIGYVLCIFFARTCFKSRVRQMMMESEAVREVLMVCEEDTTGKFLVLFRFISLPVWVKNYAIGMLDLDWWKAIVVFIPAEIFYAGIFSYVGSKSRQIADALRKGNSRKAMNSFSGVEVGIVCISLICVLMVILFGWYEYTKRRKRLAEGASSESAPITAKAV